MEAAFLSTINICLSALYDCAALLAVLFVGRYFYGITTGINSSDKLSTMNNAISIAKGGFLLGLGIAATGGMFTVPGGLSEPVMIGVIGIASMILLRISLIINDKLILPKINNIKAVMEGNVGVSYVEFGGCVATGLMIHGAISGKADSLEDKLLYASIYWGLGQVILVLASRVFNFITGYDIDNLIEEKNNAAGIAFGGFLAATGIIIAASLHGVSTNLEDEITTIAVFALAGFMVLIAAKMILAKILLPEASMTREIYAEGNNGAAVLSAVGYVAIALIFSASIAPATFATLHAPVKPSIIINESSGDNETHITPASDKEPTK